MNEISLTTGPSVRRFGTKRAAQEIAKAGFSCVDYLETHTEYHPFKGLYTFSDKEFLAWFRQEKACYEAAHLTVHQIHCPFNCPPDKVTKEELVFFEKSVQRSIQAAAVLGAKYAVFHPVIPVGWDKDASDSYAITERLCAACAREGERVGVRVALENMPGSDTTVPYSCAEPFNRLFAKIDSEWLTACLDTGHANWALGPGEVPDMARRLGKKLQVLHLHDNGGTWDNHMIPFCGTVSWNELCRVLGENGYSGTINLETHSMAQMSDELFCRALVFQAQVAAELQSKVQAAAAEVKKQG